MSKQQTKKSLKSKQQTKKSLKKFDDPSSIHRCYESVKIHTSY